MRYIIGLFLILSLTSCFGIKTNQTIEDVFKGKNIDPDSIIHQENISEGTIAFYSVKPSDVGVAYIRENKKGLEMVNQLNLSLYPHDYQKGLTWAMVNQLKKSDTQTIPFFYGLVTNPNIKEVRVRLGKGLHDSPEKELELNAKIVSYSHAAKLWFILDPPEEFFNYSTIITGLTEKGEIVYRTGEL